jgi:hypothetical protein
VAPAHCAPAGAHIFAADRRVQVYSSHGSVYACEGLNGKRVRLGNATVGIGTKRVDQAAVASDLVAYGTQECGIDTGFASVTVLRLSDGKQLKNFASTSGSVGPESYQSVDAVVVKRDAAVAWIATVRSIIGHGARVEVHANNKLLDSGLGIDPNSLKLHGSQLTWRHGTTTQSATLG